MHATPPGFLHAAQELLHRHKALLIADEVQTGIGRTGDFFAYQHEAGVEPDLVCVAKSLSGGYVPVGATLGKEWIFKKVYSSMDRVLVHSASFGSNAQAMAAGLATLAVMDDERIVENARTTGDLLRTRLAALDRPLRAAARRARPRPDDRHRVRPAEVAEAAQPAGRCSRRPARDCSPRWWWCRCCQRHRILTQVSGDHLEVIKLIPPLTIGETEVDRFVDAFTDVMDDAHSGSGLMWDFGRTLVKQAVANR